MTVNELITELKKCKDLDRFVVVSNVLNNPFAVLSIKEVVDSEEGPVYIRGKRNDKS